MINIWQESPKEKLKSWRKLREEVFEQDDLECMKNIIDWWKMAPISARALDVYDNSTWPNPWDMLWDGSMDENSIALGIAYTLHYIDWECEVLLIQNTKESFVKLVVLVDNEYVLNYNYDSIESVSVLDNCEIIEKIHTNKLC